MTAPSRYRSIYVVMGLCYVDLSVVGFSRWFFDGWRYPRDTRGIVSIVSRRVVGFLFWEWRGSLEGGIQNTQGCGACTSPVQSTDTSMSKMCMLRLGGYLICQVLSHALHACHV